jgi:antitoxin component YwqK of YwqJK toxin-antitoxin module
METIKTIHYPNNNRIFKVFHLDHLNQKHGPYKSFYNQKKPKPMFIGNYTNDKMNNLWFHYNTKKQPLDITTFKQNQKFGTSIQLNY